MCTHSPLAINEPIITQRMEGDTKGIEHWLVVSQRTMHTHTKLEEKKVSFSTFYLFCSTSGFESVDEMLFFSFFFRYLISFVVDAAVAAAVAVATTVTVVDSRHTHTQKNNGNRFDISSIHPSTSSTEIYWSKRWTRRIHYISLSLSVARKRALVVRLCPFVHFRFDARHFRVLHRFFPLYFLHSRRKRLSRASMRVVQVFFSLFPIFIIIIFRSHCVFFLLIRQSVPPNRACTHI